MQLMWLPCFVLLYSFFQKLYQFKGVQGEKGKGRGWGEVGEGLNSKKSFSFHGL